MHVMSILAGYCHINIHVDELPSGVFRPTRKKIILEKSLLDSLLH